MESEGSFIEDHAIIGDGSSTALVARDGSIDWLCWPRPDSPSVFAAILDPERGGRFRIGPTEPARVERAYIDGTNVLETRFDNPDGGLRLIDFFSVLSEDEKRRALSPQHEIVRIAICERGAVNVEVLYDPRPEYGGAPRPLIDRARAGLGLRLEVGSRLYTLRSELPLVPRSAGSGRRTGSRGITSNTSGFVGHARLTAGQRLAFSLAYEDEGPAVLRPLGASINEDLRRTINVWQNWICRCAYRGLYANWVRRSALALKLLVFAPSGAVLAAPTTSLPERIGGSLNWDYRYCWLRDAALTVRALLELGYLDESEAFVSWLLHTTRLTRRRLEVLYDVYGRPPHRELTLGHLAGYGDSRPVRVYNAASGQLQLDVYGEVVDAASMLLRRVGPVDHETAGMLLDFGRYVCAHWDLPDAGLWEDRGPPLDHTHSRVLSWVALDRLIDLASRGLVGKRGLDRMFVERARIVRQVEERGYNRALDSYTQTLDGDRVDASLLLLAFYNYRDTRDQRLRATWRRVANRLRAGPGLLYRQEDSLDSGEGAFGICSFWAIEYLARGGGTLAEAQRRFEAMLPYANDVALMAEEIEPEAGRALGNFPQAFSHVGLINAALSIDKRRREEEEAGARRRRRKSARVPPSPPCPEPPSLPCPEPPS
jgi:GH15 family glucan-1,4-alpha-glucosidase